MLRLAHRHRHRKTWGYPPRLHNIYNTPTTNRSMFSVSPTNAFSAPPVRQSSILRRCCPQELKSSRAQELKRHPRIPLLLCPQSCSRLVDPILQYQLKLGNVKNIALPEGDALLGAFHFNRADALERNRLAVGCMVIRKVQWAL